MEELTQSQLKRIMTLELIKLYLEISSSDPTEADIYLDELFYRASKNDETAYQFVIWRD